MNIREHRESWIYLLVFAVGLVLHIVYVAILGFPIVAGDLQWAYADTSTYVEPAKSFLQTGIFTARGGPDSFRTIGYPLFLSGAFGLAEETGLDWRMIVYWMQAVIFAAAYPSIYYLGRDVFRLPRCWVAVCVLFIMFSGIFTGYVTAILSDGMFAAVLITGMAYGFYALRKQSLAWSLLHVLLIIYAANVRPMLALYPFAAACMHWAYIKREGEQNNRIKRFLILAMFLFTAVGVQSPACRNWVNYGVFTPSEVGSVNLYDYLAKDVLQMKQQNHRYELVREELILRSDPGMLKKRIALRKHEALRVYCDYPLETVAFMLFYGMLNSVETHWNNTLFYLYRQTWYRDYADGSVRWAPLPFAVAVFFIVVYSFIYSAAVILAATLRRNVWLMTSVLLFLAPFAFYATSYQGARFRLWFEPFILLAAAVCFRTAYTIWSLYRQQGSQVDCMLAQNSS